MLTFRSLEVKLEALQADTLLLGAKVRTQFNQLSLARKSILEYQEVVVPALQKKVEVNYNLYQDSKAAGRRGQFTWGAWGFLGGALAGIIFISVL